MTQLEKTDRSSMNNILRNHFQRYPLMQVADLYKLLHQAALGSEHAVRNEQAARDLLERELAEMRNGPDDPQTDPLSPDGQILRVHLRPYVRSGKDLEKLLAAFIQTANEWRGSPEKLKEYGTTVARLVRSRTAEIPLKEIEAFFAKKEEQHFPAVHHSEVYEHLYRPSYRVVARQFLEEK
jgi:hypothetical protein